MLEWVDELDWLPYREKKLRGPPRKLARCDPLTKEGFGSNVQGDIDSSSVDRIADPKKSSGHYIVSIRHF